MSVRLAFAAAAGLYAPDALAHVRLGSGPRSGWLEWSGEPLIILNLTAASLLYGYGLLKLWSQWGSGAGVSLWRAAAFGAGVASLAAALLSPLDAASAELLSAHMVQHMMLMNLAAPLLVLGSPALIWFRALPRLWQAALISWRGRNTWRCASSPWRPWLYWLLYAAALWLWHLPVLYQAALSHRLIHDLQHISLFAAAFLFWKVLLGRDRRQRLSRGMGVLYLFTTSLHATLLGVFMALSPRAWYDEAVLRAGNWNLTALEDQQLAGLIMWMPGCMVYAVAAAVLFVVWLQEPHGLGQH